MDVPYLSFCIGLLIVKLCMIKVRMSNYQILLLRVLKVLNQSLVENYRRDIKRLEKFFFNFLSRKSKICCTNL